MVDIEESKLWPLDDAEEQLKTYHLITKSKLHHYRSDKWTYQMCCPHSEQIRYEFQPGRPMLWLPKPSLITSKVVLAVKSLFLYNHLPVTSSVLLQLIVGLV